MAKAQPRKKVIVAGGLRWYVYGKFKEKMEAAGLDILGHWEWKVPRQVSLQGVDAVLVLSEWANLTIDAGAHKLAKTQNVPCVGISKKWSSAVPILQRVGLIPKSYVAGKDSDEDEIPAPVEDMAPTKPKNIVTSPTTSWRAWRTGDAWTLVEYEFSTRRRLRSISLGKISPELAQACVVGLTAIVLGKPSARGIGLEDFVELSRMDAPSNGDRAARRDIITTTLTDIASRERQEDTPMRQAGELPYKPPPDDTLLATSPIAHALQDIPGLPGFKTRSYHSESADYRAIPPVEIVEKPQAAKEPMAANTALPATPAPVTSATDEQIYAKARELLTLLKTRTDWIDIKLVPKSGAVEVNQIMPVFKTVQL